MKTLSKILCGASLLVLGPVAANAAGTYYTGGYQSPQVARYQSSAFSNANNNAARSASGVSSYNQARYNSAGYNTTGYGAAYANRYAQNARTNTNARAQSAQPQVTSSGNGFHIDAGLSYKTGMWQFEMNNAGSKLHYDNLMWGVFDVNAGYDFNVGNTKLTVDAGLEYGMQLGESTMIDDDITNGGSLIGYWDGYEEYSRALAIGTSKDGDMLGLRAGVGLKDFFTWGRVKITPSIGWRHLNYKLDTSNNYALNIDTIGGTDGCLSGDGLTQCWPSIKFFKVVAENVGGETVNFVDYTSGGVFEYIDLDGDNYADAVGIPLNQANGGAYIDTLETFYSHMSDVSHSYDVTWTGPYLAMDMLYDINANNSVTARVELGLPMYDVTADQPYRPDWQHPKSIEDKGDFGSAIHFGVGANWRTAITDAVSLSLGVTYDYYNVSGADATTYLDAAYWENAYDMIWASYYYDTRFDFAGNWDASQDAMLNGFEGPLYDVNGNPTGEEGMYAPDPDAVYINQARNNGWKDTVKDEIDSFFRSLGVRVGLNIKF